MIRFCATLLGIVIAFWNLENFYDYFDDHANPSDSEFSSFGERRWTKARFNSKITGVGKSILSMGDAYGQLPLFVGICEVENSFVLRRLVQSEIPRKSEYAFVHFDSPDRRGIDVALLYRKALACPIESRPVKVLDPEDSLFRTRDILYCKFLVYAPAGSAQPDDTLHLLVNHHPSKYSGSKASAHSREAAMTALRAVCDSVRRISGNPIIMMGDFNDTPDAQQFQILGEEYSNLAEALWEDGQGSIRYNGRWELIDHFIVDSAATTDCRMHIHNPEFLLEKDKGHTGWKPFRTWLGPSYHGGLSDHLPIVLEYGYGF